MGPALHLAYIFPLLFFFLSFYQPCPLPASVIPLTIPMSGGCDWFSCMSLLL